MNRKFLNRRAICCQWVTVDSFLQAFQLCFCTKSSLLSHLAAFYQPPGWESEFCTRCWRDLLKVQKKILLLVRKKHKFLIQRRKRTRVRLGVKHECTSGGIHPVWCTANVTEKKKSSEFERSISSANSKFVGKEENKSSSNNSRTTCWASDFNFRSFMDVYVFRHPRLANVKKRMKRREWSLTSTPPRASSTSWPNVTSIRPTSERLKETLQVLQSLRMSKIYVTDVEGWADVKVYVTDVEGWADVLVFRTDVEGWADGSRGLFCFTFILHPFWIPFPFTNFLHLSSIPPPSLLLISSSHP